MKGLTIIDEEMMYKKDDYIAFMTKQPHDYKSKMQELDEFLQEFRHRF